MHALADQADSNVRNEPLRLHYGCGSNILAGWVNIDLVERPGYACYNIDIEHLPYGDGKVDEVLAEHLLEHLDFAAEQRVWREIARVLRSGGQLTLEVPDFDWICRRFIEAQDDWRDFYDVGHPDHYAGCGRELGQRWGILQTMFFGNQNGAGQYHRSAYTEHKLHALAAKTGFASATVSTVFRKGGQALRATLIR